VSDYAFEFSQAVAAELRAERGRTKQTVASIVEATGLSKSAVLHYLNGKRDIPTQTFANLCLALGVSPVVIFERAQAAVVNDVG
jgi:transcriptional regulator with XRE-family HTH domain